MKQWRLMRSGGSCARGCWTMWWWWGRGPLPGLLPSSPQSYSAGLSPAPGRDILLPTRRMCVCWAEEDVPSGGHVLRLHTHRQGLR
ncbi:hypothetical protein SK128_015858, partial [Halocaridina rubra]